jgi:hypothetical protein
MGAHNEIHVCLVVLRVMNSQSDASVSDARVTPNLGYVVDFNRRQVTPQVTLYLRRHTPPLFRGKGMPSEREIPNYLPIIADVLEKMPPSLRAKERNIIVAHDNWCALLKGGLCDCAPDVMFVELTESN